MTSALAPESKKEIKMSFRSWLWLNLLFIVLLLLLVGIGIGVYITKTQQMTQTLEILSAQVLKMQKQQAIETSQLQALSNRANHQEMQLFQQKKSLQKISLFEHKQQWQRIEISYLIHLADTSLLFGQDMKASQQLLLQVHAIIVALHDPNLDNLDQAIQADAQALAKAQKQNNTQIFAQISDLEQQMDAMPLLGSRFISEENISAHEVAASVSENWRQHLKQSLQQLKHLIIVRKTPNSLSPLVAQEQGEYINQFLHMQLGQAQWAVLHHDNVVYQSSLEKISVWIKRYYFVLNPKTQAVLNSISRLKNKEVSFPKVTLNKTLDALSLMNGT